MRVFFRMLLTLCFLLMPVTAVAQFSVSGQPVVRVYLPAFVAIDSGPVVRTELATNPHFSHFVRGCFFAADNSDPVSVFYPVYIFPNGTDGNGALRFWRGGGYALITKPGLFAYGSLCIADQGI